METPTINLSETDKKTVYDPSEDSFLLIDALEGDLEMLKSSTPTMCLEIGSGSGIVVTALAMALDKYQKTYFVAIDINPDACRVTKQTGTTNATDINVIQMDLLCCMTSKCTFDIIVLNPPYVVTNAEEISDRNLIFKTWAGGENGREVMERVFPKIPEILSEQGIFYLLVIKENDPEYIMHTFQKLSMRGEIIAERKIRGEHLYIIRFRKVKNTNVH